MAEMIGYEQLTRMLRTAGAQVTAQVDLLGRLDAAAGDGDHGTTMKRAMGVVEKAIADHAGQDVKSLLTDVGWALLGVDGGATGPLLGTFFGGMAEAAVPAPGTAALDARGLASLFEAGLAALQQQTKAKVGDKTMMDALIPAVQALRRAADQGADVKTALEQAAAAAEAGAAATRDLAAKYGRARNLGERSKGYCDAGATSMSLIWRGFAEAV